MSLLLFHIVEVDKVTRGEEGSDLPHLASMEREAVDASDAMITGAFGDSERDLCA